MTMIIEMEAHQQNDADAQIYSGQYRHHDTQLEIPSGEVTSST